MTGRGWGVGPIWRSVNFAVGDVAMGPGSKFDGVHARTLKVTGQKERKKIHS